MDKVKVIVLGTGNTTKEFIKYNEKNDMIDIIGLVLDTAVNEHDRELFTEDLQESVSIPIKIMEFSKENFKKCDIIFSPEYRKIIPDEYVEKFVMVNCHGGILPKWRGFAANAWAIMNGEKEIGFSIHRISSELDAGEIYYIKRIPISDQETYSDVHGKMVNAIISDVPHILYDIIRNNAKGLVQQTTPFAYCTKFSPGMGELKIFDYESDYYVNLFRCMAKPLGTGLFLNHKGKKIAVDMVEHGKIYNSINYMCTPGKIVNISDEKVWVKTKDNVVVISKMSIDGKSINIYEYFKNGMKLGE